MGSGGFVQNILLYNGEHPLAPGFCRKNGGRLDPGNIVK